MKLESVKGDKGRVVSETLVSTIVFLWLYHEQVYFSMLYKNCAYSRILNVRYNVNVRYYVRYVSTRLM